MNAASTPYGLLLMMPAGQVAQHRTIRRSRPVTCAIDDLEAQVRGAAEITARSGN
jgi:hypothetical protein